ncbi:MAG: hypothetical protein WDO74_04665 [Pseudomonadota bacterium]
MPEDPENPVLILIKFGCQEHMESLLKEGALYFETLKYFRELKDGGELRGDPDEALGEIYRHSQITTFKVNAADGTHIDLLDPRHGISVERLEVRYSEADRLNVYCMYALTPQSVYIDPRCLKFGTHAVLIRDKREFLKRVHLAYKSDGTFQAFQSELVRYVDDGVHSGDFAPFCKYRPYAYQSELRLALSPPLGRPFILRIGSLEDIAEICLSADLNSDLAIGHNLLPPATP